MQVKNSLHLSRDMHFNLLSSTFEGFCLSPQIGFRDLRSEEPQECFTLPLFAPKLLWKPPGPPLFDLSTSLLSIRHLLSTDSPLSDI